MVVVEAMFVEALACVTKPGNTHDQYAKAVGKNGTIKGHLLRKVLRVCTLFRKKSGRIHCRVTGRQRYSVDLRQGSIRVTVEWHYFPWI